MTIKQIITDGTGRGYGAEVNKFNALKVSPIISEVFPVGYKTPHEFYHSELLNMNVNGSVTPQVFQILANHNYDIYLMKMVLVIVDASVTLGMFGGLAKLTNGIDIFIYQNDNKITLVNKAKHNGELIAKCGLERAWGEGSGAFEMTAYTGNSDAIVTTMTFSSFVDTGLRLGRRVNDKLQIVINDNLTGLDEFTAYFFGYRHVDTEA